ncbi:hypothetical protein C2G38_2087682 [Gigaspora rosea]|uniref:Uncharacterized protein n=1 Tax=Gigaspora rosea TaxID=44941 RepID=A0A397V7Q5_9GLOM|nr:hypothetical protein C2G38_2087682 [Gigaspora rosea]
MCSLFGWLVYLQLFNLYCLFKLLNCFISTNVAFFRLYHLSSLFLLSLIYLAPFSCC